MTPSGRTSGKSPPLIGITRPRIRGPSKVPDAAHTPALVAPMLVGSIHTGLVSSMLTVKANSKRGVNGCSPAGLTDCVCPAIRTSFDIKRGAGSADVLINQEMAVAARSRGVDTRESATEPLERARRRCQEL